MLKRGHVDHLTTNQLFAIAEMTKQGLDTMTAWKLKERLLWIRKVLATLKTYARRSDAAQNIVSSPAVDVTQASSIRLISERSA